jgi:hypothetical protein
MLMLAAALLAQAALAATPPPKAVPTPKPAPTQKPSGRVGACAWARLEAADRSRVLDAYDRDRSEGLTVLMSLDAPVDAALRACAPKGNVVSVILHRASWAEMIQVGAAREIATSGVDRAGLDAAWAGSAVSARSCLHNRVAQNFGQAKPACDDAAEVEIARPLKIDDAALRTQASVYYLAKAEAEWAEMLIANSPF